MLSLRTLIHEPRMTEVGVRMMMLLNNEEKEGTTTPVQAPTRRGALRLQFRIETLDMRKHGGSR